MFRVLNDEELETVRRWRPPPCDEVQTPDWQAQGIAGAGRRKSDARLPEREGTLFRQGVSVPVDDRRSDTSIDDPELEAAFEEAEIEELDEAVETWQSVFDQGYAQGYAEGSAAAHQQESETLGEVLASLAQGRHDMDEDLQRELLALARSMARLIVHRELREDPAVMARFLSEAVERLHADSPTPRVRLHPLDAARMRMTLSDSMPVTLVDDPVLHRGEAIIEAGASRLRAGVEAQIARLQASLDETIDDPDTRSAPEPENDGSDELMHGKEASDAPDERVMTDVSGIGDVAPMHHEVDDCEESSTHHDE